LSWKATSQFCNENHQNITKERNVFLLKRFAISRLLFSDESLTAAADDVTNGVVESDPAASDFYFFFLRKNYVYDYIFEFFLLQLEDNHQGNFIIGICAGLPFR